MGARCVGLPMPGVFIVLYGSLVGAGGARLYIDTGVLLGDAACFNLVAQLLTGAGANAGGTQLLEHCVGHRAPKYASVAPCRVHRASMF